MTFKANILSIRSSRMAKILAFVIVVSGGPQAAKAAETILMALPTGNVNNMYLLTADGHQVPAVVSYTSDGNGHVIPIASGGGGSSNVNVLNFPAIQAVSQSGVWTVTASQGTSPWVVSGAVSVTGPVTVNQGTSPWIVDGSGVVQPVSGTVSASQTGTWTVQPGNTANTTPWLVTVATALPAGANTIGSVTQGTSPWVVSGTVTANAGTGNFNVVGTGTAGSPGGGVLSVQGVTSGTPILVSQSGTWTTGRTWTLGSGTDSVASVQSGAWTTGRTWTLSSGTDSIAATVSNFPATQSVTQGTSPWVVSGTVTANNASVSATGATPPASATYIGGSVTTAAPSYTTGQMNALSLTLAGALRTDSSATTQPISGTVAATQSGTWTTGRTWALSNGTDSVSASVSNFPATQAVTQSGAWTVTANAGTNLNTSALALDTTVSGLQVAQGTTTTGQKGALTLGAVTTAAPTYTNAQSSPISLTTAGLLRVDASGSTIPISGTITANQGTSPWVVSGSVNAVQSGTWTTGRTWSLTSGTDTVTVVQPSGAALNTNTAITSALPAGTATIGAVNQGTAAALAGAWPVEITDGTNVLGSAAHPVRTDPTGTTTQPVSGTVTVGTITNPVTVIQGTGSNLNTNTAVTSSVLPTGAATSAKQPAIGTAGTASVDVITVQGIAGMLALKVDGSAVTQPVSGTVAVSTLGTITNPVTVVQPSGSSLNTNTAITSALPAGANVIGAVTQSAGPWTQNVTQFGGVAISTGTGASGTGIPRVTVSNDSNILATQFGTWNIGNITGTISLPTGASTSALQTTGNTSLASIDTKTPPLGQTVMASSVPVAIASNQSAIPVTQSTTPWVVTGSGTAGAPATGVVSVQGIASGTALNTNFPPDQATNGTISALAGTVVADGGLQPFTTFVATLQGTFSAGTNIAFEQSQDNTNWDTLYATLANSIGAAPNNSYNGGIGRIIVRGLIGGVRYLRARAATFTGGDSVTVKIVLSAASGPVDIQAALPPGSNTLGAVKVTDGTNTAAVKAASTAPAATDPALVVTLSPNSASLTANGPATVSVGVASTAVVASNASRKGLVVFNNSTATVSIGIGTAAILNEGITLYPGGIWYMDGYSFSTGAINGIASAAASAVTVQEFQ